MSSRRAVQCQVRQRKENIRQGVRRLRRLHQSTQLTNTRLPLAWLALYVHFGLQVAFLRCLKISCTDRAPPEGDVSRSKAELVDTVAQREDDGGRGYVDGAAAGASAMVGEGEGVLD
ncbi:uncharacterized protein LOC125527534 [Triticum urartu]|uniref:uncharacterized protein LOC125527534 n=1 Tax=Triticum urartu TaxID=4572 RepID=UPI002044A10F|nr:uncharacterized protein LOC125527534 [Triticum urartu]